MDAQEMLAKIRSLEFRTRGLEKKIVDLTRATLPVLRDAGREHSAKAFDELFFELDAVRQEQRSLFRDNPDALISALRSL